MAIDTYLTEAAVSAPAKVILFGEHAVVYARPALAAAVDLRLYVHVRRDTGNPPRANLDGHPLHPRYHSYIKYAYDRYYKGPPLRIHTASEIPSASGLGSSAALTVAALGAFSSISNERLYQKEIAPRAFMTELGVQGAASPIDTTTSVYGGGVLVLDREEEGLLWRASLDEKVWHLHGIRLPSDISVVVGFSGTGSRTGEQVAKVRKFVTRSRLGMEVMDKIGDLTLEGLDALQRHDWEETGKLMDRNHDLLAILGVNTPVLQRLVEGARRTSFGAKLTGAGGGGSIIALTDRPLETARTLAERGAQAYITRLVPDGVRSEGLSDWKNERGDRGPFRPDVSG